MRRVAACAVSAMQLLVGTGAAVLNNAGMRGGSWSTAYNEVSCETNPHLADLGYHKTLDECKAGCEANGQCNFVTWAKDTDQHCFLYAGCDMPACRPGDPPGGWWTTYHYIRPGGPAWTEGCAAGTPTPPPTPPAPGPPPTPTPPPTLVLPKSIDSNMVLQRAPAQAQLWGWAAGGEVVTVLVEGVATVTAAADSSGEWSVRLPPQKASVDRTVTISTRSGDTRTLTNVAFGDVILCSGQSHMEFSVAQDMDGVKTISESANYPHIRMITVQTQDSTTPTRDIPGVRYPITNSSWLVSEPASFGTAGFSYPSANCYFTARYLQEHLQSQGELVPIGMISSSVGGTPIQKWMSHIDSSCGGINITAACPPSGGGRPIDPPPPTAAHFNAMIHPLARMQLKAIFWDQGESNPEGCEAYGCFLAAMVSDWRNNVFKQPDVFFNYVMMNPDPYSSGGAGMAQYPDYIQHSMYTSMVDLETSLTNDTYIHHAFRKKEVGRRMSLAARVYAYGEQPTQLSFGPKIIGVSVVPNPSTPKLLLVKVSLQYAQGLHYHDAPDCWGCCNGQGGSQTKVPVTGDGWTFALSDGSLATVCKDASLGCNGAANIQQDGIEVWLAAREGPVTIDYVLYSGGGAGAGADQRSGCAACGLYNGAGGYDEHRGVSMAPQLFRNPKSRDGLPRRQTAGLRGPAMDL